MHNIKWYFEECLWGEVEVKHTVKNDKVIAAAEDREKLEYLEVRQGICNLYMGLGARQRVHVYI